MWVEAEIARAAREACRLEVEAEKAGNVTPVAAFPEMTFEDFLASAGAVGPVIGGAGRRRVGETILFAVEATRAVTRANTNLGTILLLSPLARAAALAGPARAGSDERFGGRRAALQESLSGVLAELDVADAELTFRAIRLAGPGGMGSVEAQDVAGSPTVTLLEAMGLAAGRDAVAREYVTGFELTFRTSLGLLEAALAAGLDPRAAAAELALELLRRVPDTLIERKFGEAPAADASARAAAVLAAGPRGSSERERAARRFDAWLRDPARGWNPGTTADLVAAALFVWLLTSPDASAQLGADSPASSNQLGESDEATVVGG
jgi:triphosphoribosyl-dephospho-CoA synthase